MVFSASDKIICTNSSKFVGFSGEEDHTGQIKVPTGNRAFPIMTGQYDQEPFYADANGNDGDNAPWKVFDGDAATSWVNYDQTNYHVSDFGSPTTVGALRILPDASRLPNFAPKDFTIAYNDGEGQVTILTLTDVVDWEPEKYLDLYFPELVTSRYFYVNITETTGVWTAIAEMIWLDNNTFEWQDPPTPPDIGSKISPSNLTSNTSDPNFTVSVSSFYGDDPAVDGWKACDGDSNSEWIAGNPEWWKANFHARYTFKGVKIAMGADAIASNESLIDFTIEISDNDSDWTVAHAVNDATGWLLGVFKTYVFETPIDGEFAKVNITNSGGGYAHIGEIQWFGDPIP